MPEQKMTYAARFLKEHREALRDTRTHSEPRYVAKRTITKQAEAIREALKLFRAPVWTEQYLLEHGYIEPKTEEDGIIN